MPKKISLFVSAITILVAAVGFAFLGGFDFRTTDGSLDEVAFENGSLPVASVSPSVLPTRRSAINIPNHSPTPSSTDVSATPPSLTTAPLFPIFDGVPTPSPAPSVRQSDLLPIPDVPDSELIIQPDGVRAKDEYLNRFALTAAEIDFDFSRFSSVIRDEHGLFLLPQELITAGIADGGLARVLSSLYTLRDFIEAKVVFFRSIPVTGEAIEVNRSMIAVDKLTLLLIDRAVAAANGTLSLEDLSRYTEQYAATVAFYSEAFQRGEALGVGAPDLFTRLLNHFSIFISPVRTARAQSAGLPFGGFITTIQECTCLAGYMMWLTPGYNPEPGTYTFFISYATIASPLLYLYKVPLPGHWILGNYLPAPGPCTSGALCVPSGAFIGIVSFAGTS
jgi:hypothetical protein